MPLKILRREFIESFDFDDEDTAKSRRDELAETLRNMNLTKRFLVELRPQRTATGRQLALFCIEYDGSVTAA